MQQRVDAGELLVRKVGWLKNKGIRNTRETSMAKWFCTEAAFATANDAVRSTALMAIPTSMRWSATSATAKAPSSTKGTSQIHSTDAGWLCLGLPG
jgi:glutaryl-CoA dehydrogenase (non-decarboxylating)